MVLEIEKFKEPDGVTMNCGIIAGGTALNVVPEKCEVTIDVRFSTMEQMKRAHAFLEELVQKTTYAGTSAELERVSSRSPMELCQANLQMLDRLNRIYESVSMPTLEVTKSAGGSDAADMTARGIVTVDSVGVRGSGLHSKDEYAKVPSLVDAAKRLAAAAAFL